jgi:hypothetical protein
MRQLMQTTLNHAAIAAACMVALTFCGCATEEALPGSYCGHCDYRFAHGPVPNPCDPCVPWLELPCYGHTPTTWQVWAAECHALPGAHPLPVELVPQTPQPEDLPPGPPPKTSSIEFPAEGINIKSAVRETKLPAYQQPLLK